MIDLNSFAHEVLSIPRAHQMVMQYSVIDDSKKAPHPPASLPDPCHRGCAGKHLAVKSRAISGIRPVQVRP